MTSVESAPSMGPAIPTVAARRFEGIVFDWDDIGVPDRHADTTRIRRLLEQACEVEKVGILLSLSLHKPRWRGTGERRKLDAIFMTARSSGCGGVDQSVVGGRAGRRPPGAPRAGR
jgi:hypothetical protein